MPKIIAYVPEQVDVLPAGAGEKHFTITDIPGRGYPGAVIFVPISQVNNQWKVSFKNVPSELEASGLKEVAHIYPLPDAEIKTNRADSKRSDWNKKHGLVPWPFDTEPVLVILLYRQFSSIGGNKIFDVGEEDPVIDERDWPVVTKEVDSCLSDLTTSDVDRGCIWRALQPP